MIFWTLEREIMELVEKIIRANLKTPKGLKKFIFNNTNFKEKPTRVPKYVQSIELYQGKLLLRTFAFRNKEFKNDKGYTKGYGQEYKDIMVQEVCRRIQDSKYIILCNIWNGGMAGNIVSDWGKRWSDAENDIYTMPTTNYWFEGSYSLYDQQAVIDELGIKYCQWFKYVEECEKKRINHIPFFKYICNYIDEPKIELLVKAGLSQFVQCYKKFNLKEKSLDKIFRVSTYWTKQLDQLKYKDILDIRRCNLKNLDELVMYKKYIENNNYYRYVKKYYRAYKSEKYRDKIQQEEKMSKYEFLTYYNDYLQAAEKLGHDFNNGVYLFPKNLREKHDLCTNLFEAKKLEHLNPGFYKSYQKNLKYIYSEGEYVILPCENVEQIVNEGKILSHCVASNYSVMYAKQQTNIFFIRDVNDIERPLATLERRGKSVVQCRGYKNRSPNDDIKRFVNDWCKKFNYGSCFSNV